MEPPKIKSDTVSSVSPSIPHEVMGPDDQMIQSHHLKLKDAYSLESYDQGSILKSRDITLPTKVRLVKALVFPVFIYGCESWTIKKAER